MSGLILKNGIVFDPLNGIEGEKMDIMVRDGVVVEQVNEKECKVIDAKGMMVVPGGIDCHTHVASQTLNFARMIGMKVSLPESIGEAYLRIGYTFIVDAGFPFSKALHTHVMLERLHSLDRACMLLLDSNLFMVVLAQEKDVEAAVNTIAWLLKASKAYGVKLVNPLSSEVWTWKKEWKGSSEKIRHLEISPLEYAKFVLSVLQRLNVPSPLYLHPDGAGQVGGYEKAIEVLDELKGSGRVHLVHAQFYTLGDGKVCAEELAKYLSSSDNLEADAGCGMFNEGFLISNDAYFAESTSRKLSILEQIEVEGVAALARCEGERRREFWEAGLTLIINTVRHLKTQLSLNNPVCGSPLDYPHILAWLVSREARNRADSVGILSQIEEELTLQDLFAITRGVPAASLGLSGKGRLSIGADADIAVYDFNPETMDPSRDYEKLVRAFSMAAYTVKSGEVVVKNGEVVGETKGKTFWINCKGELPAEVLSKMERYLSFDPKRSEATDKIMKGVYCGVEV
ncbi:MAG: amidohydrolase family protein [Candidatus Freyarchaeota archaeon]|nr:amidohydrolase family protein [Candidatus Jordarchaeia archaeon]